MGNLFDIRTKYLKIEKDMFECMVVKSSLEELLLPYKKLESPIKDFLLNEK